MGDARKLYIVYKVGNGSLNRVEEYAISEPYRWEDMTRAQRVAWATDVLRRKNSRWVYAHIGGLPY